MFYVDVPKASAVQSENDSWENVAKFDTKEAAIKFATDHFGADEKGKVNLVMED